MWALCPGWLNWRHVAPASVDSRDRPSGPAATRRLSVAGSTVFFRGGTIKIENQAPAGPVVSGTVGEASFRCCDNVCPAVESERNERMSTVLPQRGPRQAGIGTAKDLVTGFPNGEKGPTLSVISDPIRYSRERRPPGRPIVRRYWIES